MARTPRIVVIGAGVGGLSAAARLAARGAEVIVLERGAVAHRAPSAELAKDLATLDRLVGLRVAATA